MSSYSGIVWDGALRLHGGEVRSVDTIRFDSPRSHVYDVTDASMRWHAWGCGYRMGLLLDLDGQEDLELLVAVSTRSITGPQFGGHGERAPRRMSFSPSLKRIAKSQIRMGFWVIL